MTFHEWTKKHNRISYHIGMITGNVSLTYPQLNFTPDALRDLHNLEDYIVSRSLPQVIVLTKKE